MLRIALHTAPGFISKAIRWQTRSKYSHASVVLHDNSVVESREFQGVRKLPWLLLEKGESVDLFSVEMTEEQERVIVNFLMSQLGKKYDYLMVLRFIRRAQEARSTTGKWFCSELVFAAFQVAGINLLGNVNQPNKIEPWRVSPGLLACSPLLRYENTETKDVVFGGYVGNGEWLRERSDFTVAHSGWNLLFP